MREMIKVQFIKLNVLSFTVDGDGNGKKSSVNPILRRQFSHRSNVTPPESPDGSTVWFWKVRDQSGNYLGSQDSPLAMIKRSAASFIVHYRVLRLIRTTGFISWPVDGFLSPLNPQRTTRCCWLRMLYSKSHSQVEIVDRIISATSVVHALIT